jgi:AraC-like DNA-binding protein
MNQEFSNSRLEVRRRIAGEIASEYDYFGIRIENEPVYVRTEPYTEIIGVVKGSLQVNVAGEDYVVGENEVAIINSFAIHTIIPQPGTKAIGVLMGGEFISDFYRKSGDYEFDTLVQDADIRKKICDYIAYVNKTVDELNYYEKKATANLIIGSLVRGCTFHKTERMANSKVSALIRYIYENSEKVITLNTLADEFGYVPMTISHIFSKYVGKDLRRFVNEVRVRKAAFLIQEKKNRHKSVAEIAKLCGFRSVATFHRIYKEYYGTSPRGLSITDTNENE